MATNVIPSYLKYANLQMAAEALLDQFAYSTPLGLKAALEFGNNRSPMATQTPPLVATSNSSTLSGV